ncbi:MAG: hypothetical protein A3E85_03340 [Gammaproteobacteria bacterium RIFCSPHIGHO2_12_FULL_45_12]|nr:MAG: hypothetical protein A3E85_03340 [Gammaproteobacteria bacterium RIFCSPHIGHO2_12_FULL_45_12]
MEFFSGSSEAINTEAAVKELVETALNGTSPNDIKLIFFHTAVGHKGQAIIAAFKKMCPHAELVGCTASGVIGRERVSEKLRVIAAMLMTGEKDEFATVAKDQIFGPNSHDVALAAAQELKNKLPNIKFISVIASGVNLDADKVIEGIESVFGKDVDIFGGTSGDQMQAKHTFQFHNETEMEHGIILAGFTWPNYEMIMLSHHGNKIMGDAMTITKIDHNRIWELDNKPAWHVLMDRLSLDYMTDFAKTIPLTALLVEIPENLRTDYHNQVRVLTIFMADEKRESFYLPTNLPKGTKLWMSMRDEDFMFEGRDWQVNKILEKLHGRKPLAVFHTDCAARGKKTFDVIEKDHFVASMKNPITQDDKSIPWLGMYGFGEFAKIGDSNLFSTQTSSLCVLVNKD